MLMMEINEITKTKTCFYRMQTANIKKTSTYRNFNQVTSVETDQQDTQLKCGYVLNRFCLYTNVHTIKYTRVCPRIQ